MKNNKETTKVTCPRCKKSWMYAGNAYLYITCKHCRFSIKKQLDKKGACVKWEENIVER